MGEYVSSEFLCRHILSLISYSMNEMQPEMKAKAAVKDGLRKENKPCKAITEGWHNSHVS